MYALYFCSTVCKLRKGLISFPLLLLRRRLSIMHGIGNEAEEGEKGGERRLARNRSFFPFRGRRREINKEGEREALSEGGEEARFVSRAHNERF